MEAMVDTGAQSTIISRSTLHAISSHLSKLGQPQPKLELPSVRLYGKDGQKGGRRLNITTSLSVWMHGMCANVPVFVQPDSQQAGNECHPSFRDQTIVRANGEHLVPTPITKCETAHVRSVDAVTLPSQKGRFLQAEVHGW